MRASAPRLGFLKRNLDQLSQATSRSSLLAPLSAMAMPTLTQHVSRVQWP